MNMYNKMSEQPTLVDDTKKKTPEDLTKEGDDLYKNRKYKAAAEKYEEAVNMDSTTAAIKLADMIYHNRGYIRESKPEYNLKYALTLYEKAWLYGSRKSDSDHISYISYTELAKIRDHLKRMGISTGPDTVNSGGYKKRKSNRKHPSKHNRIRARKHKWSLKYKRSINCKHPKGFSQRQHCKYGRKTMRKLTRKK